MNSRRAVDAVLAEMAEHLDPETRAGIETTRANLADDTLSVAIAGRLKAGKSTLLNALVAEELAATGATEVTKLVTHYTHGTSAKVFAHPADGGPPSQIKEEDLSSIDAAATSHLEVTSPAPALRGTRLVDTPGVASISEGVSSRTERFLLERGQSDGVDVVLYCMRHLHDSDIDFLEAFGRNDRPRNPSLAIGLLTRPDDIGGGRGDAMELAHLVAWQMSQHRVVRQHVQLVLPVSGLLAFTAQTLSDSEFAQLTTIAEATVEQTQEALESADEFLRLGEGRIQGINASHLAGRFGMYGLRKSISLIRNGAADSVEQLRSELMEISGFNRLQRLVLSQFVGRRETVKTALALDYAEDKLDSVPTTAYRKMQSSIDRIRLNASDLGEVDALRRLRLEPPSSSLGTDLIAEAERLLGGSGSGYEDRVGLKLGDRDRVITQVSSRLDVWNALLATARREDEILIEAVVTCLSRLVREYPADPLEVPES